MGPLTGADALYQPNVIEIKNRDGHYIRMNSVTGDMVKVGCYYKTFVNCQNYDDTYAIYYSNSKYTPQTHNNGVSYLSASTDLGIIMEPTSTIAAAYLASTFSPIRLAASCVTAGNNYPITVSVKPMIEFVPSNFNEGHQVKVHYNTLITIETMLLSDYNLL
jgi:hypothetical protein